ncbi:DUF3575 domain-containing protein [Segetibacter sp. 3557_3]|uniref:DUF3575 domain-containing protein n=1 Tax=Segetibacter sp. 3557_3 TaxID=2547429 RepID=UPI001058DDB2|nr:DUF3575 domain-containing protein [Segetibacter sp. 3557_3]TDH27308.1 DUF3575 domain-containing protein [Segetibacter sp. 3557_3]
MKRSFLLLAAAALAFSSKAQDIQKNAIKINPMSLLVKTGNISYEREVKEGQTFQVGAFYTGLSISDFKYAGYGITPEYRFYFGGQKQSFNGGYVAPFVRYQNFTISDKESDNEAGFSTIGGGAIVGWEKRYKSGFVLDIFAGPSYNNVNFKNKAKEDEFEIKGGIKGFGLRTGIAIGFGF